MHLDDVWCPLKTLESMDGFRTPDRSTPRTSFGTDRDVVDVADSLRVPYRQSLVPVRRISKNASSAGGRRSGSKVVSAIDDDIDSLARYINSERSRKASKRKTDPPSTPSSTKNADKGTEVWRLASQAGVPVDIAKEAGKLFKQYAEMPTPPPSPTTPTSPSLPSSPVHKPAPDVLKDGFLTKAKFQDIAKLLIASNEPHDEKMAAGKEKLGFHDFAVWLWSKGFSEEFTLTSPTRCLREIARRHGIAYHDCERYKAAFDSYDLDGSGAIEYDEFDALMHKLTKVPPGMTIPAKRLKHLWRLVDTDRSGAIDFEEFLVFYKQYFDDEEGASPFEDFYARMAMRHPEPSDFF